MSHRPPRPARRHAFTLIELMASIALVLLLVLGINKVFSIAASATGAGQAMSTTNRDNRAAHGVIYNDVKNIALADAPFLIINSTRVSTFRNQADLLSDRDFNPTAALAATDAAVRTMDIDANNSEADPIDVVSRTTLNNRNHRVDEIKFFARGLFRRQTGNPDVFISNMASTEAMIWYGHVRQPLTPGNPAANDGRDPGIEHNDAKVTQAQNPNNYFAQQWALGRHVMLMRDPEPDPLSPMSLVIKDLNGVNQAYIGRLSTVTDAKRLDPVEENDSRATRNGTATDGDWVLENGRYDLMGASMATLSDIIRTAKPLRLPGTKQWFDEVTYRYTGWPYPTKPHTSEGLARTAPVFLPACSQFVVEYAGDFVTQEEAVGPTEGNTTAVGPDGITDYVPISNGAGNRPTRRTRWYGFPRNVDTSDDNDTTVPNGVRIRGSGTGPSGQGAMGAANMLDVVPLRDVILRTPGGAEQAPFEKLVIPSVSGSRLPPKDNYAATDTRNVANDAQYLCAWGPSGTYTNLAGAPVADPPYPRMLRFVIAIDDPQGRLAEPQFFEYVVELPGNR